MFTRVLLSVSCIWATPWENVSSGVSDQVRLKLACSATEVRMRLEILVTETRDITLSRQRTTKALIRLLICAFVVRIWHKTFSHGPAHIDPFIFYLWHIRIFIFWFMAHEGAFSAYKNLKSLYTEKVAKHFFRFWLKGPCIFCLWHMRSLLWGSRWSLHQINCLCINHM